MEKYFLQQLEAKIDSKKNVLEELKFYDSIKELFEEKNLPEFDYKFEQELIDTIIYYAETKAQEIELNQVLADYYSYSIASLEIDETQKRNKCFEYVAKNKEKFKAYLDADELLSLIGSHDVRLDDYEINMVDSFIARNFHEEILEEIRELRKLLDVEKTYSKLKDLYATRLKKALEEVGE